LPGVLEGSINSLGLNVGGSHALAVHTLADEFLNVLLADNHRATVEDDNELLLPGESAAAVSLAATMTEAAVENESAEIGSEVLKEFHIEKCFEVLPR
jgi:hypothetical protein